MKFKKIISLISAAVMAVSALSVSAVPVSAADDTDSWKTVYSRYLKKLAKDKDSSNIAFSINDLDDNGTPELILSEGTYHGAGCTIYTYKSENGKLKKLGSVGSYGTFDYDPENKIIESSWVGMGLVSSAQFRIKNEKMTQIIKFEFWNMQGEEEYALNGKNVSKKTYDKYADKYAVECRVPLGRAFSLTETDIKCALGSHKNYKAAYKAFIADRLSADSPEYRSGSYTIKDITNDNIPELFFNLGYRYNIFTFKNGRMNFLGSANAAASETKSGIGYCDSEDMLMFSYNTYGQEYTFCKIANGYVVTKDYMYISSYDGRYMLNNNEVKKAEYNKKLKKYKEMKFLSVGKPTMLYGLDKDNIKI